MKIWVDDLRAPPDFTWRWAMTSADAIEALRYCWRYQIPVTIMSLDHDLGGDDTTRPVVLWCCERDEWPVEVVVHSANPVGREWIEGMIKRYKP